MSEYAPDAIRACFNTVKAAMPAAQLGGILGDRAHTYGYHRGRNYVSKGDYSVSLADDKMGDGEAASALDITLGPTAMRLVTQRLIAATNVKNPVLTKAVREFFGTTDGKTVVGRDVRTGRKVTSDSSHLWHVHISFFRRYATNQALLQQVASIITGAGTGTAGKDMNADETEKMIIEALRAYHLGGKYGRFDPKKYSWILKNENNGVGDRLNRLEKKVKP